MEYQKIYSYKDLIVWQKAMDLVIRIYELTKFFPKEELYGLTSQIRRAAVSLPANIAEGRRRSGRKEYMYFLNIAYASGAELETLIEIVKKLSFTKEENFKSVDLILNEVMRILNKIINNLRT